MNLPGLRKQLVSVQVRQSVVRVNPVHQFRERDAQSIVYRVGDALLMSRKDQTRMAETEQAVKDLADAGGRIVGTLMNAY